MESHVSLLELRKFVAPEFIFGSGARSLAARFASNLGARHVLIVTDPGIINAGWVLPLLNDLNQAGIHNTVFDQVSSNPRDDEVMAGANVFINNHCNLIIAIGGGSPMDCAKGIGIVSSNQRHILSFEGVDEVPIPAPPLICIPSTAGTSADVSQFAIINDVARKVKIAIISKAVVPDVALIDPFVTTTMDPYLTACTGIDALTHAVEAYCSNAHSPITDLHALQAIRLIKDNLLAAIHSPDDLEARTNMMLASLHAGLAFSNASLGAVHAMAHSLGGFYGLPHGECNAILLEHVMAKNFESAPDRFRQIASALGQASDLPDELQKVELVNGIRSLREKAGIITRLGAIGVTAANIPELAEKAMNDPCMATNPAGLTQLDIEALYASAL
ncbi:MAG: iron-containing alcohol dehydrogenase [Anaerolineae bacterium]|nr:iron-containing alcohol dehydrogenase [Anaerolineae bacterium]